MKKLVVALILALMSLTAFGQIVHSDIYRYEFHLGDYVFKGIGFTNDSGNGEYKIYDLESEEVVKLSTFIKQNKEKIEEKYGVDISQVSEGIRTVSVVVYEKGYLESLNESKRLEKERKKMEINERLNKLNEIF